MLTKMAMLFFIIALALILTGFGNVQRKDICSAQASFVAQSISGTISNVVNSPVEDERKLLALESTLSVGKTDYERYEINLLKISASGSAGQRAGSFSITTKPPASETVTSPTQCSQNECCGGSSTPFENLDVRLSSDTSGRSKDISAGELLVLQPSNPAARSRFLVVIKCREKKPVTFPPKAFLFIEDCTRDSGDQCMGFDSEAVDRECGFR